MRSMTGFGSAALSRAGTSATVECRSVNNRYLKISLRCSASISAREQEIESLVREQVTRGTVNLTARVLQKQPPVVVLMNEQAVRDYRKLFRKLERETGLKAEPSLEVLAQLPGVFSADQVDHALPDPEWQVVREAVVKALDRMVRMRVREGANLKKEFGRRATAVTRLVKRLERRAPQAPEDQVAKLEERVRQLLERRGVEVEEADLLRELAILAERSDVTEELTRLTSHVEQFRRALDGEGAIGRRLEFLVQEMHREANTVSSKSSDLEMARLSVELKVELDRLKEQVMNVE